MARPRSDIRERIVRAALPAFLERGVDGASLRHVAKGARTSVGMISYYFGTKDELFMAVLESAYSGILADFRVILAHDQPFQESVVALYHRFGALTAHETDVMRLIVKEALTSRSRRDAITARFGAGHIPLVLQAAARGKKAGYVDPELHTVVAGMCLLLIGGIPQVVARVAQATMELPDFPEPDLLADQLAGVFLEGIRPGRSALATKRGGRVAKRNSRRAPPSTKNKRRGRTAARNEES